MEGDDRRTRIGKIMRKTSLDELPQLLNVLRGDMSLVGPRPERPEFVELFEMQVRRYGERHRVKAGITGWAQVHGLRGQTSIADRAEFDNYYIENWSLLLDFKILMLTVLAVLRPPRIDSPTPRAIAAHRMSGSWSANAAIVAKWSCRWSSMNPAHVGLIPDGLRRWADAQRRHLGRRVPARRGEGRRDSAGAAAKRRADRVGVQPEPRESGAGTTTNWTPCSRRRSISSRR